MIDFNYASRYAQYGDVSPKIDVYAFGVVLYELISAKEAVVKTNKPSAINESKGLVALVEYSHPPFILNFFCSFLSSDSRSNNLPSKPFYCSLKMS